MHKIPNSTLISNKNVHYTFVNISMLPLQADPNSLATQSLYQHHARIKTTSQLGGSYFNTNIKYVCC